MSRVQLSIEVCQILLYLEMYNFKYINVLRIKTSNVGMDCLQEKSI